MKTRRRTFIKASGMGAAGMLVSGCTEPTGTPPGAAKAAVKVSMTIWGSCLYEFKRVGGAYTLRVGFLNTAPADCKKIEHIPELLLTSGYAKKVGGNANLNKGKWILPKGTLTIDSTSVSTSAPLDAVGVNDGPQPCPRHPSDPSEVRSLGFIPPLKTKGNFKLKDNWTDDALVVAVLDRGIITAHPVLNDRTAMPVWYHRTDDTAENDEHAFSDTTRYEVQLSGSSILFKCANETLEIEPDGVSGIIDLQLNAMPTDSIAMQALNVDDPLSHFCALYAPFRNAQGDAPDAKQRYVPRYRRYCSEQLKIAGAQGPSPGKYCSGGRLVL